MKRIQAIAILLVGDLIEARVNGAVRKLQDCRHNLYSVVWNK